MYRHSLCYLIIFVIYSNTASPLQSNNFTKGFSEFSKEFYWQCAQAKPGNVIVSPISVANVLALLSQGTSGTAFEELTKALHLMHDSATIANQFSEHRELIQRNVGNATLSIVNEIYVQEGQQLNRNFQEKAISKFRSGVELLNFAESEKSAQIINHFVESNTNGKIIDLISPDSLSSSTRSVLVNAIYFKGNWEIPFDESFTIRDNFFISETESVAVDFMTTKNDFNYGNIIDLEADALEMNYANSSFAFLIILPKSRTGLPTLERKLKEYNLEKIVEKMSRNEAVDVKMPKFKIEYKIQLNNILKNLGMQEMFHGGLSEILESGEDLEVSEVIHNAFIEVNEKGSEAAAATTAILDIRCCTPEFVADHPFVFFIRETGTNTVLFSGRIVNFNM